MGTTSYMGETRLAVGGMAEVRLAIAHSATGIPSLVVLKRLLPHLADDSETVEDFLSEARLMVALHHPNIVSVRDLGRDRIGFFIVQEYLSGADLRHVSDEVREREMTVPVPIACRVVAEIAAALQYAHRASDSQGKPMNLVHRDINPGNVVLTYDGRVKLIDFGVAKSELRLRNTQPGAVKGQPAYVAPEALEGGPVDHRADIFSLGVVLHELLTGRLLFHRPHPAAILDAILREPLPAVRDSNPQVPEVLDTIVQTAMDRDPARRFPSAGQMREAIDGYLRSAGLVVGPRQLAGWIQTTMAEARRARILLEREVRQNVGVLEVRGATSVVARTKPPPVAVRRRPTPTPSTLPAVGWASIIALILLMLLMAAFLLGRSAAQGPNPAGA